MFAWLSANLINIALVAVIVLIVALLIRGMIRDRKAGNGRNVQAVFGRKFRVDLWDESHHVRLAVEIGRAHV